MKLEVSTGVQSTNKLLQSFRPEVLPLRKSGKMSEKKRKNVKKLVMTTHVILDNDKMEFITSKN